MAVYLVERSITLHTIIDLSLRQLSTPEGTVTICQVEANIPIWQWDEEPSEVIGKTYSLGKEISPRKPLHLDISPFVLILEYSSNSYMCCCVAAPSKADEPTFHIKLIEEGKIVSTNAPVCSVGKGHQRCEVDFITFDTTQQIRIETIEEDE